ILDTATTPQLEAEGLARDVVRAVQDARKSAGFDVSDRIRLELFADDDADASALEAFSELIAGETLALGIDIRRGPGSEADGRVGAHRGNIRAAQYSNVGGIVLDVVRWGEGIDV